MAFSKRYTNRCVLHHCKFLMSNKPRKDIPYVRGSGHKSEASIKSYAKKLSFSTKSAIFDTFSRATGVLRQTMLLSQRKQQKTTKLLSQKHFHPNRSQAESSNFKSFQFRHCQCSLESYFEVDNYDFDSSLSSSQTSKFLEL